MTSEGITVLKEFSDHLERGEIRWDLLDRDIVVVDHDIPDAGDYRGHEGFRKWIVDDWASAWESWAVEYDDPVDAGDTVVSAFTLTARGKGSGIETTRRNATVNTVEDGRMTRIEYYSTVEEARAAAGLAAVER